MADPEIRVNKPRILLADDHPHILANLRQVAETIGEVVSAVSDGGAAVKESLRLHPDVVVLDLAMPGVGGLEAARVLRRDQPDSKVIICTMHTSREFVEAAFAAGAYAFVRKQSAHEDLVSAIRAALAGEHFVSPSLRYEGPVLPSNDAKRD